MFSSRFFWKLYLTFTALVLVTSAGIGLLLDRHLERTLLEELEQSLKDKAVLLEPFAARVFAGETDSATLEQEVAQLGPAAALRITLILPVGKVLADSEKNPAEMENHWARPEVREALVRPFGLSQRFSATLQDPMLYVARAVRQDGRLMGVARVAIPLSNIEARLTELRRAILMGALAGVLGALMLGMIVARRITTPLAEMTGVAEAMRNGRYEARVKSLPKDEMGLMGDTLNRLGAKITEQIGAISVERTQLRSMLAGMVEGVIAVDENDQVLFCNPAACQMLEIKDGPIVGRKLGELTENAELLAILTRARSWTAAARQEIQLGRDNTELALDAHATLFEGGGHGSVVVVLEDITNLKRLERIRRDFVANVSHEIKTPLTSIKGYVETLLTGALYDEQYNLRFLHKIDDHVGRLANIVQDLLSLARIESQEGSLPLQPVDWRPILESALRRQEAAIQARGLICSMKAGGAGWIALGDPEAMTQVLDNLLDNAVKYTPSPGTIRLRLFRDNGRIGLEVKDTGIGIPEEDRERIFERFYRVDKARSREVGGTGLGLSIVKHLVQALHGEVHVESEVGRGSRFTVLLPAA